MTSKPVEFLDAASLDYEGAFDWYLDRSELVAARFASEVERAISLISDSPQRWPSGDHGTRRFLLQRFPFVIVYRERPAVVQVIAVAHSRRRPGYWKQRL